MIDLVKAPDWLSSTVVVNGTRLDVTSAAVRHHRRVLDMHEGTLSRQTVFEDGEGRRTRVESVRFASTADQHLCGLQVRITPENHTASVTVHSGIDGTGYNLDRPPIYAEPPPSDPQMKWQKWAKSKHLEEVARAENADWIYLETRTIDTGITIGYAASTTVSASAEPEVYQRHKYIEQTAHSRVAAGDTLTVDKLVTVYTSRDVPAGSVRQACLDDRRHTAAGFAACRDRNREAWLAKWADSDVRIDGDTEATRAVRFNIYHLLIAANESDPRVNIGANSLSGSATAATRSGTPKCSSSRSSSIRSRRRHGHSCCTATTPRRRPGECPRRRGPRRPLRLGVRRHRRRDHTEMDSGRSSPDMDGRRGDPHRQRSCAASSTTSPRRVTRH